MTTQTPIFIINLKRDSLKKKHMVTLCSEHNLEYTFFEAVDGKDLSTSDMQSVYSNEKALSILNRELGKGELGCSLSHLAIYQKMLDSNIPKALIFEDDIIFSKTFNTILKQIPNFIPDDFDCLLLGSHSHLSREKECKTSFFNRIKVTKNNNIELIIEHGYGTYGYLISLSGAQKILLENATIKLPIDFSTGDFKKYKVYKISPSIISIHKQLTITHSNLQAEREELSPATSNSSLVSKKSHYYIFTIKRLLSSFLYFVLIKIKQLKP